MKLVIDTNVLISALIKNGISRKIILSPIIHFLAPEFTLQEIEKYKKTICKKACITSKEFNIVLQVLFERITIVPKEEYKNFVKQAQGMITDKDDIPFIALCLAKNTDGIWTDDAHFTIQKNVTIYRTKELAYAFRSMR
jgi:predicted nucleic acid-binding protein